MREREGQSERMRDRLTDMQRSMWRQTETKKKCVCVCERERERERERQVGAETERDIDVERKQGNRKGNREK